MSHPIDPKRYPRAYMLRARREQAEATIRAPVAAALMRTRVQLVETERALKALEAVIGSKIGGRVVEKISHAMAQPVRGKLLEALAKAHRAAGSGVGTFVQIEIHSNELKWLDPDSLERRVLEEWREQSAGNLRAVVGVDGCEAITGGVVVLQVDIPDMRYREHIPRSDLVERGAA
jgi:hypothetical protein